VAVTELDPDVLARALGYPYERPPGSFRYWPADHRVEPLTSLDARDAAARTVVLAIGSNAAPEQLRRKFSGVSSAADSIPVLSAVLRDHDVVHAALVASYGSVPATLLANPCTTCRVHVTLLDPVQLERMHESESLGRAYDLVEVDPSLVDVDLLGRPERVEAYVARSGPMLVDGAPVALAAIQATGREVPAWAQPAVLAHLATLLSLSVDDLVVRTTTDEAFRRDAARLLRRP
jgi:hypothetical protein